MELNFSLSELNKKSPYILESHLRSLSIKIDETEYFSSVIMRNDNPRFDSMNEAIDRFIQDFQDKLR